MICILNRYKRTRCIIESCENYKKVFLILKMEPFEVNYYFFSLLFFKDDLVALRFLPCLSTIKSQLLGSWSICYAWTEATPAVEKQTQDLTRTKLS